MYTTTKLISDEMLSLSKINVIELVENRIEELEIQCEKLKVKWDNSRDKKAYKRYVLAYNSVRDMALYNKRLLCTIRGEVFGGGVQ